MLVNTFSLQQSMGRETNRSIENLGLNRVLLPLSTCYFKIVAIFKIPYCEIYSDDMTQKSRLCLNELPSVKINILREIFMSALSSNETKVGIFISQELWKLSTITKYMLCWQHNLHAGFQNVLQSKIKKFKASNKGLIIPP